MKHSLLFFLCLWRMMDLYSQCSLTSELNKFRVNDTIVKQQIEYKAPGRSGKDVLWDFGKLSPINKKYTLIYSARKGVDSMIVGREHHTRYYYDWQKDSVWLWGFENSTTQIENSKPELLLQLPMHYGDKVQGYYQGEGKYCGRLHISTVGRNTTEADAYGMIILPGKDTLKHVLRIKMTKLISETISPLKVLSENMNSPTYRILPEDSIDNIIRQNERTIIVETYQWYALGYRYPIFETIRTGHLSDSLKTAYFSTAFFYPPGKHMYLQSDTANLDLQKKILADTVHKNEKDDHKSQDNSNDLPLDFSYNVYPNPVQTKLTFEFYLSDYADISYKLYYIAGQQLTRSTIKNYPGGVYQHYIDMNKYPKGEYILQISMNEKVFSEKIIKR